MKHLSLSDVSDIYIAHGLLAQTASFCLQVFSPSRIHIVTDTHVAPLYLDKIAQQFSIPVSSTILPAGEAHKRLSSIEQIYSDLLHAGMTRKDLILALGGGVVGDMAGFAAATFLRGISLCQIPTTLLAQVDSSVGGKTGVDLPQGKNLIGAFYQPRLVLIDPDTLQTLPDAFWKDGMAEVIKYGYIANPDILTQIASSPQQAQLADMIYACVKIKRDVVAQDPFDTGLRMILNFGHTIGHAVEKLGNYTDLTHGQAVAIGMVAAMQISNQLGAPVDLRPDLIQHLQTVGLPTTLPYDRSEIFQALLSDKKKMGEIIHFILVRTIGQAEIVPIASHTLQSLVENL